MPLVLGVDTSTQSTKAVLVDAADGRVVQQLSAPHPAGTSVDPRAWLKAYDDSVAPLLEQATAVAIGGQQHGMVALDESGEPVRDALLWNDMRSAAAAEVLVAELGGPRACAELTGLVFNASYTVTKLRWLRDHEPEAAARVAQVMLPHDYLTWHLLGRPGTAVTDRGEASGTGYWSPNTGDWLPDVVELALGRQSRLPRIAGPHELVGERDGVLVGPGTGDNAAAALGLDLQPGDVVVSIGTSGVASMRSTAPVADALGGISGFADATGEFLPLAATVNASRILDLGARLLGVDHAGLDELALASVPGAHGLTLLPYLDGERTPKRPDATGVLTGLTSTTTRADVARAHVEGLLHSLLDAVALLAEASGTPARRVLLIGGGTRSAAVRKLAPAMFDVPVLLPAPGEYVALGAARQAAWVASGEAAPPAWPVPMSELPAAEAAPGLHDRYAELRNRTAGWTREETR